MYGFHGTFFRRQIVPRFERQIKKGILEGINSFVQVAKAKASGSRSVNNSITMVYISLAGKLDFGLTT